MAIELNHNIKLDFGNLTNSLDALQKQLESFGDKFSSSATGNGTNPNSTPSGENKQEVDRANQALHGFADKTTALTGDFDKLIGELRSLNNALNGTTSKVRGVNSPEQQRIINEQLKSEGYAQRSGINQALEEQRARKTEQEQKVKEDNASRRVQEELEREERRDARSYSRFAKGMLLGAGTALSYQAGSWGATSGMEANALNTSGADYRTLLNAQYNSRMGNVTSAISTASMALPAVGAMFGGPIGAGVGMLGAGAINYFTQKYAGEDMAQHQFALDYDFNSWQLQKMGMSGKGAGNVNVADMFGKPMKAQGTTLQDILYSNNDYAPYAKEAIQARMTARRDSMDMLSEKEQAEYGVNIQKFAQQTNMNPQSLNLAASNLAAFTGENANKALQRLLDVNMRFGGDTAANTSKMLQIMSSTPLSAKQAESLVNKWQYNDAMLSNKVNSSLSSPSSHFSAAVYGQILGLSNKDMESLRNGVIPKHMQEEYRAAQRSNDMKVMANPRYQIMEQLASVLGLNIQANPIGGVTPSKLNKAAIDGAASQPEAMKNFGEMVIQNLSKMTVTADTVYLNTAHDNPYFEDAPVTKGISKNTGKGGIDKRFTDLFNAGVNSDAELQKAAMTGDMSKIKKPSSLSDDPSYKAYLARTGTGQGIADKKKGLN